MHPYEKIIKGLIIFNDPYPIGVAGANRIHTIAKGLHENNVHVEIFILRPTENPNNIINAAKIGEHEGIRYEYLCGTNIKSVKKHLNALQQVRSRIVLGARLLKLRNKIDFIIYPLDSLLTLILVKFCLRFSKVKIVRPVDEFPPFILNPDHYSWIYKMIYKQTFYKLVDMVLVITSKLGEFYRPWCRKDVLILHLPMTVDTERFINQGIIKDNTITYCGNLGLNNKDGVSDLINAFSLISDKYPKLTLTLVGSTTQKHELKYLYNLVQELKLSDRIIFIGYKPAYEIPSILSRAMILVLARPENKQAEGGFPTKLGEYLATGNPIVVTNVGEIPLYLKDRQNAFIAKPSDYQDFAAKLDEVLSNYDNACLVGEEGKKTAEKHFNYKNQGLILVDALKKMINVKN